MRLRFSIVSKHQSRWLIEKNDEKSGHGITAKSAPGDVELLRPSHFRLSSPTIYFAFYRRHHSTPYAVFLGQYSLTVLIYLASLPKKNSIFLLHPTPVHFTLSHGE